MTLLLKGSFFASFDGLLAAKMLEYKQASKRTITDEEYMKSPIESSKRIAYMFDKACGIPCVVIDPTEADSYEQRLEQVFCKQCAAQQIKRFGELKCQDIHRYAALQAERWSGKSYNFV